MVLLLFTFNKGQRQRERKEEEKGRHSKHNVSSQLFRLFLHDLNRIYWKYDCFSHDIKSSCWILINFIRKFI
jgi:hypothetical protein